MTEKDRWRLALHEARHVIVAVICGAWPRSAKLAPRWFLASTGAKLRTVQLPDGMPLGATLLAAVAGCPEDDPKCRWDMQVAHAVAKKLYGPDNAAYAVRRLRTLVHQLLELPQAKWLTEVLAAALVERTALSGAEIKRILQDAWEGDWNDGKQARRQHGPSRRARSSGTAPRRDGARRGGRSATVATWMSGQCSVGLGSAARTGVWRTRYRLAYSEAAILNR